MLVTKNSKEQLKVSHPISYAIYAEHLDRMGAAYMSQVIISDLGKESTMLAVLDTGCNNTGHGDGWVRRYENFITEELPIEEAAGNFQGVGDKAEVSCKRSIPLKMETADHEIVPGSIISVELKDSDAPLLLSIHAPRKLQLILDLERNAAYGKFLDKEPVLEIHNGRPAIRLHPSQHDVETVAMMASGEQHIKDHKKFDLDALDGATSEEENTPCDEVKIEEEGQDISAERHLPLHDEKVNFLSGG